MTKLFRFIDQRSRAISKATGTQLHTYKPVTPADIVARRLRQLRQYETHLVGLLGPWGYIEKQTTQVEKAAMRGQLAKTRRLIGLYSEHLSQRVSGNDFRAERQTEKAA